MIYDCFTFFNELDLLEIRLNVLDEVVDKFVLVESTKTHQGKPKPLNFDLNKERYKKFENKIIHIIVADFPSDENDSAWTLERYQREMIVRGLKDCRKEDLIIVSDVDEIPSPESIKSASSSKGISLFMQKMYYYFLNCMNKTEVGESDRHYLWVGSAMCTFDIFPGAQNLRNISINHLVINHPDKFMRLIYNMRLKIANSINGRKVSIIENGGWHFSYLGGVKKIVEKLEAFAHTEYNKPQYKDEHALAAAIAKGEDIFGRGFSYSFVPVDNTFPEYIQINSDKYKDLIYPLT